jgi:hypothetical protein
MIALFRYACIPARPREKRIEQKKHPAPSAYRSVKEKAMSHQKRTKHFITAMDEKKYPKEAFLSLLWRAVDPGPFLVAHYSSADTLDVSYPLLW